MTISVFPSLPHSEPVQRSNAVMHIQEGSRERETDLRIAAQGFEALFINQVLKSARSVSFGEGLGDSSGLEMTQSMLDMQLSDLGASHAGLGVAEAVYRQFAGIQRAM